MSTRPNTVYQPEPIGCRRIKKTQPDHKSPARRTDQPTQGEAHREGEGGFQQEARKRGLLIGKGGFYGNVLRMSPPLNISKTDVDEATRILDESFAALKK